MEYSGDPIRRRSKSWMRGFVNWGSQYARLPSLLDTCIMAKIVRVKAALMSSTDAIPSGCHHHWVIEPANGPVSQGVCRLCQQVREFENSISSSKWATNSMGRPRTRPSPNGAT